MTSLHPAEATRFLVEIPERGGSVVIATVVGDNQFTGNRTALVVIEDEEPELRGSLTLESGTDSVIQLMKDIDIFVIKQLLRMKMRQRKVSLLKSLKLRKELQLMNYMV